MGILDFILLLLYIVSGVVSLIMIIKYFQLCKDVAAMREAMNPLVDFEEKFALLISAGEKEEAKRILLSHICKHSVFGEAFGSSGKSYTEKSREEIKKAYSEYLEALEMDFDFEAVDAFIKAGRGKLRITE